MSNLQLAKQIVAIADERKALDPVVLDIRDLTIVTDYFVLLTGTSRPHVLSIADSIREELAEENICPAQREADHDARWILLDYGGVVVHIFQPETRSFYNLERLWNNAKQVRLDAII
ncbi:MAG: ribosome silencing factor [Firmicutes bacterium]|jgi:ribosome-associated protein|nr:ribosome silencing factor [Bacillota bacterium]